MIGSLRCVPTSPGLDIAALLADFADGSGEMSDLAGAAIAAAGPVLDDAVKLTNADVTIEGAAVRDVLHKPVRIMNDLEAVAWALPHLTKADTRTLLDCDMPLKGSTLAINIGTGFGAALLVETRQGAHVCALEPGHMKLATAAAFSPGILTARLSIEDVLSGKALTNPAVLAEFWGWQQGRDSSGAGLFANARESIDGQRFIDDFSAIFGQVCGDLVLATGGWGGVYMTGSVANAWAHAANIDKFRSAFCDKGPMLARMVRVPVHHITLGWPVLLGLAAVPVL
jgi:glucokinase